MNSLFEKREYLLRFYGQKTKYIDAALKFLLALLTFIFINNNIGFKPMISNTLATVGLSVVCAFLPIALITLIAAAVILVQFYTWASGVAIITAAIFMLIFIFCLRFTPGRSVILLITPIAFMLKIPMLIPIVCGLVGSPVWALPMVMGTLVYYMIHHVSAYNIMMGDLVASGLMNQIVEYPKQIFENKEMMLVMLSMAVCLWAVYGIRKLSIDNAWKIAIVTGAIMNIIFMIAGGVALELDMSYVYIVIGSFVSVLIALILEFFVFSVDYSRTEYLQFEDDEYYYYVKAIPKISVAAPEKTVKTINERQETKNIDTDAVNKAVKKVGKTAGNPVKREENLVMDEMDEMLLAKSLQEELDIQKLIEEELKS